jgi:hypothetical protein
MEGRGGSNWSGNNYRNYTHDGGWADHGHWNQGYTSYYGRGWGYQPGFGWGIGLGNFYGYYGYPYYGRGGYGWGRGWRDGYYGYWGPDYDTYGYDGNYSYPLYGEVAEGAESPEDQSSGEGQLPPMPTEKELSGFTNQQLQSFIAWVSRGFTKELGQFNNGDTWVKYFKLDNLRDIAPQPPRAAVAAGATETISPKNENLIDAVLSRMESTAKSNEYRTITDTWGFKALHVALQEASRPADERAASVLTAQTEMLNKSLERVSTGERWRKHLEIDNLEKIAKTRKLGSDENLDEITTIFERVAQNPEYQVITQLPGFEGVYSSLRSLSAEREPQSSAKRVPPPPQATETR